MERVRCSFDIVADGSLTLNIFVSRIISQNGSCIRNRSCRYLADPEKPDEYLASSVRLCHRSRPDRSNSVKRFSYIIADIWRSIPRFVRCLSHTNEQSIQLVTRIWCHTLDGHIGVRSTTQTTSIGSTIVSRRVNCGVYDNRYRNDSRAAETKHVTKTRERNAARPVGLRYRTSPEAYHGFRDRGRRRRP